jgi:hypothetical protein
VRRCIPAITLLVDLAVTERGKWHFEFFNEIDALPHNLELDVDAPYLAIFRDFIASPRSSTGVGDTNLGVKWNFHNESPNSRIPALRHLAEKVRLTGNTGILFAGNTSAGIVGITGTRLRFIRAAYPYFAISIPGSRWVWKSTEATRPTLAYPIASCSSWTAGSFLSAKASASTSDCWAASSSPAPELAARWDSR